MSGSNGEIAEIRGTVLRYIPELPRLWYWVMFNLSRWVLALTAISQGAASMTSAEPGDSKPISHINDRQDLEAELADMNAHIMRDGDKPHAKAEERLELLAGLAQSELGRFLILAKGCNAYWTDYATYQYLNRKAEIDGQATAVEAFILQRSPDWRASQQRFLIFQKLAQDLIKPGVRLASVPCGLMADLLTLDYAGIDTFELWGLDVDEESIALAAQRAHELNLAGHTSFFKRDAWALEIDNEVDGLLSSGLNIYVEDYDQEMALYGQFHRALKKGGKLISSFFTPPPECDPDSIWDMSYVDPEDIRIARILFGDFLGGSWQKYRTSDDMEGMLGQAGFEDLEFFYDPLRIMPTVTATKK